MGFIVFVEIRGVEFFVNDQMQKTLFSINLMMWLTMFHIHKSRLSNRGVCVCVRLCVCVCVCVCVCEETAVSHCTNTKTSYISQTK